MNTITTDVSTLSKPAVPHHVVTPLQFDENCSAISMFIAMVAMVIGYIHIYQHQHSRDNTNRKEDRLVSRVLFAAPIYSIYSIHLTYQDIYNEYMYVIRDWYGAFVIYGFMGLCYMYIGGEENVIEQNTVKTLRFYERATVQYCYIKPLLTVITAFLQLLDRYEYGDWSLKRGYIYITVITSFSVTFAAYGLFSFLKTARGMMKTCKLVLKFVTVAFIVFGTYWQGVILALIEAVTSDASDAGTVAARYQNWLVCVEMLPSTIAMLHAFPVPPSASSDAYIDEHVVEYGVKPPNPELVVVFKSSSDSLHPLL